jgi:hypothetical protein
MKISTSSIYGQVYLLPFLAITHDKNLNGNYELYFGWLKWEIIITF